MNLRMYEGKNLRITDTNGRVIVLTDTCYSEGEDDSYRGKDSIDGRMEDGTYTAVYEDEISSIEVL